MKKLFIVLLIFLLSLSFVSAVDLVLKTDIVKSQSLGFFSQEQGGESLTTKTLSVDSSVDVWVRFTSNEKNAPSVNLEGRKLKSQSTAAELEYTIVVDDGTSYSFTNDKIEIISFFPSSVLSEKTTKTKKLTIALQNAFFALAADDYSGTITIEIVDN